MLMEIAYNNIGKKLVWSHALLKFLLRLGKNSHLQILLNTQLINSK